MRGGLEEFGKRLDRQRANTLGGAADKILRPVMPVSGIAVDDVDENVGMGKPGPKVHGYLPARAARASDRQAGHLRPGGRGVSGLVGAWRIRAKDSADSPRCVRSADTGPPGATAAIHHGIPGAALVARHACFGYQATVLGTLDKRSCARAARREANKASKETREEST